jgi:hypothetical protein
MNSPSPGVGLVRDGRPGGFCLPKNVLDLLLAFHQVPEAELQRVRPSVRHLRVFCKLTAWIQREHQAPLELEEDYRACGFSFGSLELCCDYSLGRKAQPVPVEGQRFFEVVHCKSENVQSRDHGLSFVAGLGLRCSGTRFCVERMLIARTSPASVAPLPAHRQSHDRFQPRISTREPWPQRKGGVKDGGDASGLPRVRHGHQTRLARTDSRAGAAGQALGRGLRDAVEIHGAGRAAEDKQPWCGPAGSGPPATGGTSAAAVHRPPMSRIAASQAWPGSPVRFPCYMASPLPPIRRTRPQRNRFSGVFAPFTLCRQPSHAPRRPPIRPSADGAATASFPPCRPPAPARSTRSR